MLVREGYVRVSLIVSSVRHIVEGRVVRKDLRVVLSRRLSFIRSLPFRVVAELERAQWAYIKVYNLDLVYRISVQCLCNGRHCTSRTRTPPISVFPLLASLSIVYVGIKFLFRFTDITSRTNDRVLVKPLLSLSRVILFLNPYLYGTVVPFARRDRRKKLHFHLVTIMSAGKAELPRPSGMSR